MRGVQIFSGTSHPALTNAICERLGTVSAPCQLRKFSNGETSVEIGISVRNQDVFIVQSGSSHVNDSIMELLIMISACKGGSAKSITAVMPYFPYSRQSKKKSHRGAITARMLANLLTIAGVDHIITIDLHASQMQGFFSQPVDNLYAESLLVRWIRLNVPRWNEAVVVSKNAGGSKRVTSLADALKINFGIVTTDRARPKTAGALSEGLGESAVFFDSLEADAEEEPFVTKGTSSGVVTVGHQSHVPQTFLGAPEHPASARRPSEHEAERGYADGRASEVVTGRLVQGHLVDDDYPASPSTASVAGTAAGDILTTNNGVAVNEAPEDPMSLSFVSTATSQPEHPLGGSYNADASSDEEEDKIQGAIPERTITLVGDVKDRTVFIVDDMIDTAGAWIAAAETVVKRGGAKSVYCIATHGLFGEDCLEQLDACSSVDWIVVTNTFPLPVGLSPRAYRKLVVIDASALLSEGIRRHHYGESLSGLFITRE